MKALALITALWLNAAFVYAQQSPTPRPGDANPTDSASLRFETTLVTVPFTVTDKQGRSISGLKAEHFRVFEDKIEQEIAYFADADKPFTIALLLDISDSAKLKLRDIQDSAIRFIDELKPEDGLIVIAFDKNVTLLADASNSREEAKQAINRITAGGGTSLYDAVGLAISDLLKTVSRRKAILLFTDGEDTTSNIYSREQSLRLIEEFDGLVYAIQYDTFDQANPYAAASGMPPRNTTNAKGESLAVARERATAYLRSSSSWTGGRFHYADSPKNLSAAFTRIAHDLRRHYSLGYYPANQSPEKSKRQIKLSSRLPGIALRYRKYYIHQPARHPDSPHRLK